MTNEAHAFIIARVHHRRSRPQSLPRDLGAIAGARAASQPASPPRVPASGLQGARPHQDTTPSVESCEESCMRTQRWRRVSGRDVEFPRFSVEFLSPVVKRASGQRRPSWRRYSLSAGLWRPRPGCGATRLTLTSAGGEGGGELRPGGRG